jgi:Capsule assembly protein Wzi
MKNLKRFSPNSILIVVLLIISTLQYAPCLAQSLPVGTAVLDDYFRRMQMKGERDSLCSFLIRPIQATASTTFDALYLSTQKPKTFLNGKGTYRWLPATIRQQVNAHHPYGFNDGSMISARGYQAQFSAGMYASLGILSIQLQPEFVWAANNAFDGFPGGHTDSIWKAYADVQNDIDLPEKFGNGAYARVFPGQSSIRVNYKKLSFGISTENLWWGPGIRNALTMSNNAPGFLHLSLNSRGPMRTFAGHFEWQVIAGKLKNSGILPFDTSHRFEGVSLYKPRNNSDRYINAMVISWQPKWVKNLFVGFSRSFYVYANELPKTFDGYLPIFSSFFKSNVVDDVNIGRDQLLSLFFRWVLPKEQAEFYWEYGRNDHSQNLSDFIVEPEHSRAYTIGFRKLFQNKKNTDVEIWSEITQLQLSSTNRLRAVQPWYVHYQTRHGYTNQGQVLGAGIGPGSNSQSIGANWHNGVKKIGVFFERLVHNNDFYYQAFTPTQNYSSHWVDLSLTATRAWQINRVMFSANASIIHSFNYQWRYTANPATLKDGKTGANNLAVSLSTAYLF